MQFNAAYDPFRALKTAWQAITRAPLPLLVGGAILVLTEGGGGGGGNFGTRWDFEDRVDWEKALPVLLVIGAFACCVGIVLFLISSWVKVGFANAVEEVLRTGRADLGSVFDAKGRFGSMLLARLLVFLFLTLAMIPIGLAVIAGFVVSDGFERNEVLGAVILIGGSLLWLPAYAYIHLGLMLSEQAVALEGAGPMESVRRSWSLAAGHRWMLLWYAIVTSIFSVVGLCACCIGIFLTMPMTFVAQSESFLALTRGSDRSNWWIEKGEPPPPPPEGWGAPPSPPPPPPPASTLPPPLPLA